MKRDARHTHRRIWSVMGLVLPLIAVCTLALKQSPPDDVPAVQIEAPKEN